jgi:hypothetical protein
MMRTRHSFVRGAVAGASFVALVSTGLVAWISRAAEGTPDWSMGVGFVLLLLGAPFSEQIWAATSLHADPIPAIGWAALVGIGLLKGAILGIAIQWMRNLQRG